ncbi:MAG TPA: serine hydrolase domain-containing protein, partial [Pyrinomonadaceae bacterium]|nr:serine hydrolase domain-containing protein [Pyrinomonadaceae bacterium]
MKSIKAIILFLLIVVLTMSFQTPALGYWQINDEVVLPATPVGQIAGEFLKILNLGDKQELFRFLQNSFTEQSLKDTPPEDSMKYFERLYRQSGGIQVMSVSTDSNERFLVLDVKSKRSNHWARMFFVLSREQKNKLVEIGMFGTRSAEDIKANAWTEKKLSQKEALKEIALHLAKDSAADRFSGTVLIAKGDQIIFQKAYGMAEKTFAVPNKIDTKFNLASMNKIFTAIAVAQLVEAGKLSFEDSLAKILPEYPNQLNAQKIKIKHLLSHTAGLGDFFDNPEFRPFRQKYQNPQDYFRLFADKPLFFEPGARFSYSNAGFVVLGAVIEKVSGENYFDYIREHIYKPAGMMNTDSYELTEVVPNLAVGYGRFEDDPMGVDPRRSNIAFLPWKGSPAGGGYSTAPDLLKFVQAFRSNKLISAKMKEVLIETKTKMIGSHRPGDYGYGFIIEEFLGKKVFGHSGGGANSGINSHLKVFADGSYTVI